MKLETVACEVCGSEETQIRFEKRDKFSISDHAFKIVRCLKCNLSFISPRPTPDSIGQFYPETYSWKENEALASGLAAFANKAEKFYRHHQLESEVKRLKKYVAKFPCKVLDVGCGTGDRLNILKKQGCEVYGIETSAQAEHAKNFYGLDVFQGTLPEAAYPDQSFDLIVLYNVLEHVHRPRLVLDEISRILRPGGVVVIEVPNNRSWQSNWFGKRWAAVDVPRDLFYFDEKSLEILLIDAGFQKYATSTMTNFWHPPTFVISLFNSLDPQLIWSRDAEKQKGGIVKRIFWAFWTLLFAPIAYIENLVGRGALMTLFATKKDLA